MVYTLVKCAAKQKVNVTGGYRTQLRHNSRLPYIIYTYLPTLAISSSHIAVSSWISFDYNVTYKIIHPVFLNRYWILYWHAQCCMQILWHQSNLWL